MVAGSFSEHVETNTFESELHGFGKFCGQPQFMVQTQLARQIFACSAIYAKTHPEFGWSRPGKSDCAFSVYAFEGIGTEAERISKSRFVQKGVRYEYGFSVDQSTVHSEWLVEYATAKGRTLFERTFDRKTRKYKWKLSDFLKANDQYGQIPHGLRRCSYQPQYS